jgi:pimeloyl-ACP methyl ester carboxylesterase
MKMQSQVTGKGRPIVLVPGGLTGWVSWEPFEKTFTDKQRTVIRVQLLGVQFGLENRPLPEDYSVKTESGALAATLDSLGPAMWVLRGTEKWDDQAQQSGDIFETHKGDISEDMLAEFLQRAGFVQQGQSARDLPQWDYWVPFRRSLRVNPFVVSHRDNVERLKNFQPPTLLVKGTGSAPFLHNIIEGLSETIPNSRIVEFPGGHAPHIVSTDKFILELEKFQNDSKK